MAKNEDPAFDKDIGARVREAREARGMPQAELGRQLKFPHPSSVYRYETGLRGFTKPQLLVISRVLQVSIDWLLTGEPSPYGAPNQDAASHAIGATSPSGEALKPLRPSYPKVVRQLYTSGRCGEISDADEQFVLDYLSRPGNARRSVIDLERALKADRYGRDPSAANFVALQEIADRQQEISGVKRTTSDVPPPVMRKRASNDHALPPDKPRRRRKDTH
jgi:transcriptional regulator with XRE-family HTH domain